MSTTTTQPLTADEARAFVTILQAGNTDIDYPFHMPQEILDSLTLRAAVNSLVRKKLLKRLPYDRASGLCRWKQRGRWVLVDGEYVYGPALREAYQAWYESQEDDDGGW